MRKRKPAIVPPLQHDILADLKARGASSPAHAVRAADWWQGNALNRLKGRGFIAKADGAWWLTPEGAAVTA
jgi:hypothetical protein